MQTFAGNFTHFFILWGKDKQKSPIIFGICEIFATFAASFFSLGMEIVIIGSGNLATQLGLALTDAGLHIVQVYSRTADHARELAGKIGAGYTANIDEINDNADVYIMSVKDDAISEIAAKVCAKSADAVFVHTAGSISMDVFNGRAQHYGVLYPMQTFSKSRKVNFKEIPYFLEASDDETLSTIRLIAERVSDNVVLADSAKRKKIHLAAVLACNFTNHCYRLAEKVIDEEGIDFKLFLPLIDETARKVAQLSPKQAQTGPMVRYDTGVMQMQIDLLNDERTKQIYRLMADSIHEDATSADDTCPRQKL